MSRENAYPTFRAWLNDESYNRQPIDLSETTVSLTNVQGVLPVANGGTGTGVPTTDGQVLVGATGGAPTNTALTAGPGISITNGPGSITISQTLLDVVKVTSQVVHTASLAVDTPLIGMSITPGIGDFLVFFDGMVYHENDKEHSTISIYVDGNQILPSQRTVIIKKDLHHHIGTMSYIIGVADGEVIDVRWRNSAGGGNDYNFGNRSLIAIKLAE